MTRLTSPYEDARTELANLVGCPVDYLQARVYAEMKETHPHIFVATISTMDATVWLWGKDLDRDWESIMLRAFNKPYRDWQEENTGRMAMKFTQPIREHARNQSWQPFFYLIGFVSEDDALMCKLTVGGA